MSSDRYNLRPRPNNMHSDFIKETTERMRKPRRQPKRDPSVAATKSKTMAIPAPSSPVADTRRLYEKPSKWTQEHLRIANFNRNQMCQLTGSWMQNTFLPMRIQNFDVQ